MINEHEQKNTIKSPITCTDLRAEYTITKTSNDSVLSQETNSMVTHNMNEPHITYVFIGEDNVDLKNNLPLDMVQKIVTNLVSMLPIGLATGSYPALFDPVNSQVRIYQLTVEQHKDFMKDYCAYKQRLIDRQRLSTHAHAHNFKHHHYYYWSGIDNLSVFVSPQEQLEHAFPEKMYHLLKK